MPKDETVLEEEGGGGGILSNGRPLRLPLLILSTACVGILNKEWPVFIQPEMVRCVILSVQIMRRGSITEP